MTKIVLPFMIGASKFILWKSRESLKQLVIDKSNQYGFSVEHYIILHNNELIEFKMHFDL